MFGKENKRESGQREVKGMREGIGRKEGRAEGMNAEKIIHEGGMEVKAMKEGGNEGNGERRSTVKKRKWMREEWK